MLSKILISHFDYLLKLKTIFITLIKFKYSYSNISRTEMETKLEQILTHSYKEKMISYLRKYPEDFEAAIELAIADKQPYSWRAAWLLWSVMDENDGRLQHNVRRIVEVIPFRKYNQQRELLKILYKLEIEEELEGLLFDECVTLWKDIGNQASVRYNAFKLLVKFAQKYPELSSEISYLTGSQYVNSLSAGVKDCVSRMMKGKCEKRVNSRE